MSPCIGFVREIEKHPISADTYGFRFAWLEGMDGTALCRLDEARGGWDNLSQWPHGRIFGSNGEYRWRSSCGKIHAVMILDQGELPPIFPAPNRIMLESESNDDHPLILWGEWVNPKDDKEANPDGRPIYYANEIPKQQEYPLDGDRDFFREASEQQKTPCLIGKRYRIMAPSQNQSGTNPSPQSSDQVGGEFLRCKGFDLIPEMKEKTNDVH